MVKLAGEVQAGDGIVFAGDREQGDEQGGRVYQVARRGGDVELSFGRDAIDPSRLHVGQQIWKTDDPKLTTRLRKTFTGPDPLRRVPLDLQVTAAVGELLRIVGRAENGATCEVVSDEPLAEATKHPLSRELLAKQLGRLGGTAFKLRHLAAEVTGQPMAPLSVLGKMRKALAAQLEASSQARPPLRSDRQALARLQARVPATAGNVAARPAMHVLCRSLDQLREVIDCGVSRVMVDFQDIREYRRAVQTARTHGAEILLATPRIQKPDEMGVFRALAKHGADGLLVRNLAGISFCREREIPFVCDYSLNAANQMTVDYLRSCGAQRVTASYDLNRDQLLDLVEVVPTAWLEVVVHQHMPMFHMEHCVFCAVLSPGTNKTNCGRPCDLHQVKLRDRIGMQHTLQADVGCRNTLYNAVPQSAAEAVPTLLDRGLRDFRIELLNDRGDDLRALIDLYRDLLASRVTGKEVWRRLNAANRVGVTRGTLEERRNPLAIL